MGWMRPAAGACLVLLFTLAGAADAQRPKLGIGVGGGVVLGTKLMDFTFPTQMDEQEVQLAQQVDMADVAIAAIHAEWYAGAHFAVRAHAAWGAGRTEAFTSCAESPEFCDGTQVERSRFETGYGAVAVTALDAGVSIWPWTPRSVGFAPFVTVGTGAFRYDFRAEGGEDRFFRPAGPRTQRALLVGLGADMHIWRSLMLRLEGVNHMVDRPLGASDFRSFGEPRASTAGDLGARMSNVRLALSAHVYFPFGESWTVPD